MYADFSDLNDKLRDTYISFEIKTRTKTCLDYAIIIHINLFILKLLH